MKHIIAISFVLSAFSVPASGETFFSPARTVDHQYSGGWGQSREEPPNRWLVGSNDDYYRRQDEQNRQNQEYYRRQDEQRRQNTEFYREQDRQRQRDEEYVNQQRGLNEQRSKSLQRRPRTYSEGTSPDGPVTEVKRVMEAAYWKYDNKLSPDGRVFNEFDHWLEFHQDGTFKETIWVKVASTGNMFGGGSPQGSKVARVATGKYTIVEDTPDFLGELVYDDDPAMPVRLFMPRKLARFWPPEGFNLSQDPHLDDPNEMNWKRTRGVGERPPQFKNF